MKNLIIVLVLGLGLVFPYSSYAGVNVFSVEIPVEKSKVRDNVKAGYVAGDLGDTFHVQKPSNSKVSVKSDDRDQYLVFGVDINSLKNRI